MRKIVSVMGTIDEGLDRFCTIALMVALGIMIGATLLNIVLRWFNTTLLWVEPMTRQLVFIAAFLGGAVATGSRSHIAIDLVGRLLDTFGLQSIKAVIDRLILSFCLLAVVWTAYAGYQLVLVEWEFGKIEFLGIHSSVFIAVVPVGLLVIAYRFFYLLVASFFSTDEAG
ncbi:TRAP transporter small permease [Pseudobacteriovorax antillogorgiicola]|uniref:TRAP-type C4-dicarboxylate transport system, small permease component n=1 Tax=Pseudobacteriovorax antillogorgiicola TaxID=1513793 RepID=A0A1Y6CEA2_9BACT|nr:TRAP transporter small permease subunit [Pseudobacteriovorax antillogorgiicola]TCS47666.1 TRAP-type C4-dicarboxylate transport system permease small subunit [Pseudobacteriovorax antillogorgiicola]SMF59670.1 TRAP-type C4-dicarboxylate transport system, small permease component [Pseudobacteriovorax antillogorgiicola]